MADAEADMSENALDSDGQVRIARLDSADKCLATLAGNRHSNYTTFYA